MGQGFLPGGGGSGGFPIAINDTIYVDIVFGLLGTPQPYNFDTPYPTGPAAEAVAVAGDTIHFRAGTYDRTTLLSMGKDGVNYYFEEGCVFSDASVAMVAADTIFNLGAAAINIEISGYLNVTTITNVSHTFLFMNNSAATAIIKMDTLDVWSTGFITGNGEIDFRANYWAVSDNYAVTLDLGMKFKAKVERAAIKDITLLGTFVNIDATYVGTYQIDVGTMESEGIGRIVADSGGSSCEGFMSFNKIIDTGVSASLILAVNQSLFYGDTGSNLTVHCDEATIAGDRIGFYATSLGWSSLRVTGNWASKGDKPMAALQSNNNTAQTEAQIITASSGKVLTKDGHMFDGTFVSHGSVNVFEVSNTTTTYGGSDKASGERATFSGIVRNTFAASKGIMKQGANADDSFVNIKKAQIIAPGFAIHTNASATPQEFQIIDTIFKADLEPGKVINTLALSTADFDTNQQV